MIKDEIAASMARVSELRAKPKTKILTVGQRVRIVSNGSPYEGKLGTVKTTNQNGDKGTVYIDDVGSRPFFTTECEPASDDCG